MEHTYTLNGTDVRVRVATALETEQPVLWGISHLIAALTSRLEKPGGEVGLESGVSLLVVDRLDPFLGPLAAQVPVTRDGMAILGHGNDLIVTGGDIRGIVYGLAELADRIRHGTDAGVWGTLPTIETTTVGIRSMGRLFTSDVEDREWFYDKGAWIAYLDMLITHRFNRVSLGLAMGYNYPYHNGWITEAYFYFPYPFLMDVPGHSVNVAGISAEEKARNIEIVRFVGREAARRGLEFQLALWTQRYDFYDVPRASHRIVGVEDSRFADYCKQAIGILLAQCPQITGLTLRVHVEGGIAEGNREFWEGVFQTVRATGRTIEIDMHAKGIDPDIIKLAKIAGGDVVVSPKYMAEHMGLPYHQADIRDKEVPAPDEVGGGMSKFSSGARKFLRSSYGDLLQTDREFKVLHRIWAGTQRFLLWGDPALAAGYSRGAGFCDSAGVERWEPLTFKGRMGTGVHGQRHPYKRPALNTRFDWERYEYEYRVWGRLIHNPNTDRDSWFRHLRFHCGDAAHQCEEALSFSSRVLPLITTTHGPSISNNHYWPEIYTNMGLLEGTGTQAYGFDTAKPVRFGNVSAFDPKMFASAREFIAGLFDGEPVLRYGPLDVATWLKGLAHECDARRLGIKEAHSFLWPEVQRIYIDTGILSGVAKYFAYKLEAACWMELHLRTLESMSFERAFELLKRAVEGWREAAELGARNFDEDITFGPQRWLRGSWQERLPEIEAELLELEGARFSMQKTVHPDASTLAVIRALTDWVPTASGQLTIEAPAEFELGEVVRFTIAGASDQDQVDLHYRHVNHAERWVVQRLKRNGVLFEGEIPASYTAEHFHLQYFVTARNGSSVSINPGLDRTLSNDPYNVIKQRL